jgi:hypothetical protein
VRVQIPVARLSTRTLGRLCCRPLCQTRVAAVEARGSCLRRGGFLGVAVAGCGCWQQTRRFHLPIRPSLVSSSFHFLSYDSRHRVCTFPPPFAAVPTPLHHSFRPGHPHPSSLPTRHTDPDSPPTLGALHRHHPAHLHQASPSSFDIIVTQHVLLPLASNVSSATSASFTIICHVALRLLWSMLPLA